MIIDIDLQSAIPEHLASIGEQAMIDQVLQLIGDATRAEWIRLAMEQLQENMLDYVNAIQPVEYLPGTAIITLLGDMANKIEHGMDAYDMRDTLLGPNIPVVPRGSGMKGKHQAKNGGYYRAIPFRHKVGKQGAGFGKPFEKAGMAPAEAAQLGRDIYAMAKQLQGSTTMPGEKTKWGGRLGRNVGPKLSSAHKSPLFAGMVKSVKTYETATQSQYVTFRTISTNVPEGWQQTAKPGVHLVGKVNEYVAQIAPMTFDAYTKEALGDGT